MLTSADRVKLTGPDTFLIGIKRGLASNMLTYSQSGTNQKGGQSLLWNRSRNTLNRRMDYNYAMVTPLPWLQ